MARLMQLVSNACNLVLLSGLLLPASPQLAGAHPAKTPSDGNDVAATGGRERISLNAGWRFSRFTSNPDGLSYDGTLKPWILLSANDYIVSGAKHDPPSGTPPGRSIEYVQASYDDSTWEAVDVPHDWAIKGPFGAPGIGSGEGSLPVNGVGWYRRNVTMGVDDVGKTLYLDIDGAFSYAAVWLNSQLVGGWPYGYASFRLDLTQYMKPGDNVLAIRLDNAVDNSRWYPGAGIYRNIWLTKINSVHVGHYGTYITTPSVSTESATLNLTVEVENRAVGSDSQQLDVATIVRALDPATSLAGANTVATFPKVSMSVAAGAKELVNAGLATVANPKLWGPPPGQTPHMYVAVTTLSVNGTVVDTYETRFGIRSVTYDANKGIFINGQAVRIQGTNNHHDHGSIGSAFHYRAAERQLHILQEMGSNALRMSHNPPAPELLDLADKLGFMVLDEIFDCWNRQKTTNDFHQIFPDWHEPDLRLFVRRDRNHPSIIAWSFGNEVGEQGSTAGGTTGQMLHDIIRAEDPTRPTTTAMNSAKPGSPIADVVDLVSLNYQGEGQGTSNSSSYPSYHRTYPNKVLWTSESASALSTRGTYLFPVTSFDSATIGDRSGGNSTAMYASAYDLYGPGWGSSPDKVFREQDSNPEAAGEFVWTGFDYIGEPTPYSGARSSYFGIVDLAGFKKDRYYLYQSRWRPDLAFAHILPHWTWPERVGQVTPVHVFSSADEAELFVNGKSQGRLKKAPLTYRFRWDSVVYAPGDVRVVTYKNGTQWATDSKKTAGSAAKLNVTADQTSIAGDGYDLSYVSVAVVDVDGEAVPRADNSVTFSISGPGQVLATDNGDPTDKTAFPSLTRKAFGGQALAIVRANPGASGGKITVSVSAAGLTGGQVTIQAG